MIEQNQNQDGRELARVEALRVAREKFELVKNNQAGKTLKKYNIRENKGLAEKTIKKSMDPKILDEVRRRISPMNSAKDLAKKATPWGMISLMRGGNLLSDWMYGLAMMAAMLKDMLDIAGATGILYIMVVVATFLCSIFIAMMMLLGSFSNGAGRAQQKMIRSWLVLLGGTTVEMLFGINFLPIETLTVLIVYVMMLSSRAESKKLEKQERLEENYTF